MKPALLGAVDYDVIHRGWKFGVVENVEELGAELAANFGNMHSLEHPRKSTSTSFGPYKEFLPLLPNTRPLGVDGLLQASGVHVAYPITDQ